MISSTRSITGASETRRPRDLHSFARVILVLAWAPFWFNTALFLCGEAVAAAIDGRSDNVSQSVSAAQPARAPDGTHSGCRDHRTNSSCGYTLNAGAAINEVYIGLPTESLQLEWFAIDIAVAADLTTAIRSANRAPRAYYAPPPFRLYLRTLRLLI